MHPMLLNDANFNYVTQENGFVVCMYRCIGQQFITSPFVILRDYKIIEDIFSNPISDTNCCVDCVLKMYRNH